MHAFFGLIMYVLTNILVIGVGKSAASDRRKLSGNSSAEAMDIEPGKRRINGFIGIDPKWRLRVNPDEQRHHEHPFQVKNV